jgi:hypothetical protein
MSRWNISGTKGHSQATVSTIITTVIEVSRSFKGHGTWKNVFDGKKFVEAPFEGKSEFIGGSGKFENIKGSFAFKGAITLKRATWTGEGEVEY